jgi:hypothetical protein
VSADLSGKPVAAHAVPSAEDQHALMHISAPPGSSTLRLRVRNDFGIAYDSTLPKLGARNSGLRLLSESWTASRDMLTVDVAGMSGAEYELSVWNPEQAATLEGGELLIGSNGLDKVRVRFPAVDPATYTRGKLIFHFSAHAVRKISAE